MKKLLATIAALSLMLVLGASLSVAAETSGFDADARFAEGSPPVIPHKIVDNATGESCLACHLKVGSKATLCPHPVRTYCTSCHLRSSLEAPAQAPAKGKKAGK
jgi:hypothetical protein